MAGMNVKAEVESTGMDTVKLLLAVVLLIGGIVLFYILEEYSTLIRVLGLLAISGLAIVVALQSVAGRRVWDFCCGGAHRGSQGRMAEQAGDNPDNTYCFWHGVVGWYRSLVV